MQTNDYTQRKKGAIENIAMITIKRMQMNPNFGIK